MGRHKKNRICKSELCLNAFKPTGIPLAQLPQVNFLPDELETIRLCDLENLTQEQAGIQMGVSRGTIQRIITSARKKIASALVNGEAIVFNPKD